MLSAKLRKVSALTCPDPDFCQDGDLEVVVGPVQRPQPMAGWEISLRLLETMLRHGASMKHAAATTSACVTMPCCNRLAKRGRVWLANTRQ
eukprot:200537-Chlamydomonas_euryale.AAC.4